MANPLFESMEGMLRQLSGEAAGGGGGKSGAEIKVGGGAACGRGAEQR